MKRVDIVSNIPIAFATLRSGKVSNQALAALYGASTNPSGFRVILIQTDSHNLAQAPTVYQQPQTVILVRTNDFSASGAARLISEFALNADYCICGNDPDSQMVAVELARLSGHEIWTEVISCTDDQVEISRQAGRLAELHQSTAPTVMLFQSAPIGPGQDLRVEDKDVLERSFTHGPEEFESLGTLQESGAERDLGDAEFIICAGLGVGGIDAVEYLAEAANMLGATLGATRVVTDNGWVDHDRQIGSTGSEVAPAIYITFGVSGAIQHLAGVELPERVISVNTDGGCTMMRASTVPIVSDAAAVARELVELLRERH